MKNLIFIAAFLTTSTVFACTQEAQFIATVKSATVENDQCFLTIESFSHFSASQVCPLWESDVLQNGFMATYGSQTCSKMTGSEISGYLVRPVGSSVILLD